MATQPFTGVNPASGDARAATFGFGRLPLQQRLDRLPEIVRDKLVRLHGQKGATKPEIETRSKSQLVLSRDSFRCIWQRRMMDVFPISGDN